MLTTLLCAARFDAVIFDDVLKSGTDAQSELIRERLWTDVCSAAINRLSPEGIVMAASETPPTGHHRETARHRLEVHEASRVS